MVPDQTTAPARPLRRKLFATVATVGAVGILGAFGTFAAFTATTANTGNSIASGTVKVDQHAGYTSLYNASGKKPGEATSGCVRVTYAGSLPAAIRLYSSASITNGSKFDLVVQKGSGLTSPGASMSCAGFSASSTVYNGTLGSFPSTFGTANQAKAGGAAWAENEAADYRFTVTPKDNTTANANTTAQSTTAHDFTWEARGFEQYANSVLTTSGVQSYWRFGEPSGITAYDATPAGGRNPTYVGGPTFGRPSLTSDAGDPAVRLNGTSSYLDVGDQFDFAGQSAFSVEMWLTPDSIGEGGFRWIAGKDYFDEDGRQGWAMAISNSPALRLSVERYRDGAQSQALGSTTMTAGVRRHVVATYDGSTLRLYIDGAQNASVASSLSLKDTPIPLAIGASSGGGNLFGGDLDDTSIYNRALTAAEVKTHYDLGK